MLQIRRSGTDPGGLALKAAVDRMREQIQNVE
jgi:uncharacterized protein YicC (UPF0701 family)